MPNYFRCEEPTLRCPHARTREVLANQQGICPINNPLCEHYRQPVPLLTALLERNPALLWSGIGVIGLVLIVLLVSTFGGENWEDEIQGIKTELAVMDSQLNEILSRPVSSLPNLGNEELQKLSKKIEDFKKTVEQVAETNADQSKLLPLQETERMLKSELDGLLTKNPDQTAVNQQITALQLEKDYEDLATLTKNIQDSISSDDPNAKQIFSELIEQIQDSRLQVKRLIAPESSLLDQKLVVNIQINLEAVQIILEQLAKKTKFPFLPQDAGLSIAVSPSLVEPLILPLLQSYLADAAITADADVPQWFISTTNPAIAPGAWVTVIADDPYSSLLDGSTDLVFAIQAPDESIRTRFAAKFSGQELQSRTFSEVVALDAVVLIAHPNAVIKNVDQSTLNRGQWLARSADVNPIKRLINSTITIREIPDPLTTLLAESDSSVIGFYHQWRSKPNGQYLPFKTTTETPAILPSSFSIATEEYPLSYRIMAAHAPNARPTARQFIDYLTSDRGQEQIAAQGFIDLRLLHRQDEQASHEILTVIAKALGRENIANVNRYPTNLHFDTDKSELDIKAKADLVRLAKNFPNSKVIILGFTDSTGSINHNLKLSEERAATIVKMLQEFNIDAVATGLGQKFPLDTNDTEQGRARNRRAEVWIEDPEIKE